MAGLRRVRKYAAQDFNGFLEWAQALLRALVKETGYTTLAVKVLVLSGMLAREDLEDDVKAYAV